MDASTKLILNLIEALVKCLETTAEEIKQNEGGVGDVEQLQSSVGMLEYEVQALNHQINETRP